MDDPSFIEVDLDEEKAKRSILVTNVPENVSPKDVVIHFQKKSNGGGEVVNLDEHRNEHRSSVVITFEHPSIVEKAIARPHSFKGNKVNVQRYPVGTKIPEIFSHVDARINLNFFDGSVALLKQVLLPIQREFGIQLQDSHYGYVISGTYEQITLCRKHILRENRNAKAIPKAPTGSGYNDIGAEAASPAVMGDTSITTGTRNDEKKDAVLFQSVPIILEFIFTVQKYSNRIQVIESRFRVKIEEAEGGEKVKIIPLPGCTRKQHDDACEDFINLYREINDGPMMSQGILLRPGNGSSCSAKDAVKRVLEMKPIVIQKMDEQGNWLFYGEETNVRSAIKEISKMLMIDNPLKKTHKKKVRYVSSGKEENSASASYGRTPSGNNGEEDVSPENPNVVRNPVYKDFPGDTQQPLVIGTKKGFRLTVYQGDITQEKVDVIVNFTDEYSSFSYGLPTAILKSGGRVIQEDFENERKKKKLKPGVVVSTRPGRLNCSSVMHIMTNKYTNSKKEEQKKLVEKACFHCLKLAQNMNYISIAFPAVGTGQQGMPLDVCASTVISAVEEYMKPKSPNKNPVTDIRFVHLDPAAAEAFKAELTRRYKDSIVKPPHEADNFTRSKHSTPTLPNDKGTGSATDNKKTGNKDEEDVCPICLDGFHDPVPLSKCNHKFCKQCIELAFQHRKVCPTCGMAYGVQTGNMPPGTMNHYFDSYMHLPGYERCGTIRIDYYLPSGTQGPEHPNPGKWYDGASRTAYLPDCAEGREVLGLLKKAFNARLTFTIGRSVTTGASNVVTWNDIHHKTNPRGGATGFGYPDPTYLKRVKEELAAKGIS